MNYLFDNYKNLTSQKKFWLLWLLALILIFLIQVSTLDVLPSVQKDEIQIADYGRMFLNPDTDWSANWIVAKEKPIFISSYLGPLISELSYRIGSTTGLGPRIASLMGGLLAATFALKWLLARGLSQYTAFYLSLSLLLDPLFVLSQRMARMDSWAIAFCIASCWLIRSNQTNTKKIRFATAGGCAVVALFIWPSALFLYPLITYEFIQTTLFLNTPKRNFRIFSVYGFWLILGGVVTTALLIIPMIPQFKLVFGDAYNIVISNVDSSRSASRRIFDFFSTQYWLKLIKAFTKTLSLVLPLLAIIGAITKREKGLIFVTFVAIAMIFASLVYELRLLYMLPYLLVLASGFFQQDVFNRNTHLSYVIKKTALITLVIWAVATSLFIRSVMGFKGKDERDRNRIQAATTTTIGAGNYNVFLGFTYELYYAARSLGWKIYIPYGQLEYDDKGNWIDKGYAPEDEFIKLFSKMDYAIFYQSAITPSLKNELTEAGLQYNKNFFISNVSTVQKEQEKKNNRNMDILLFYLRGQEEYGPYVLYSRTKKSIALK